MVMFVFVFVVVLNRQLVIICATDDHLVHLQQHWYGMFCSQCSMMLVTVCTGQCSMMLVTCTAQHYTLVAGLSLGMQCNELTDDVTS